MPDNTNLANALAGGGTRWSPYDARRRFANSMLQTGMDASPIQTPWQGAARLAQALAGGWAITQANEEEMAAEKKNGDALAKMMVESDPQKRSMLLSALYPR